MTNFNERTNTLLYKNIISHTLFSKEWCFLCVWEMSWRRGQTAILNPSSSSTIAVLLSHLGKPSVYRWLSRWHLVFNCPGHLVILLSYVHLLPLFLRLFTQMHLFIDGSVEGQSITKPRLNSRFSLDHHN